jgi:RNA polymerase sigma-70 factor, ECF subfamily
MDPERDLVERLSSGDNAAYQELVRNHASRLLGVATRLVGDGRDADDVVQETFVAAWRGMANFDGRAALSTWLHRIAVNASLARLRTRARRQEVQMEAYTNDEDTGPSLEPATGDARAEAETRRTVWGAVDALSDDDRTVLILRDVEELSSKEVAAQLGLSDAAVRQRLHRARQLVAERLRPEVRGAASVTCGGNLDLLQDAIDHVLVGDLVAEVTAHIGGCAICQGLRGHYEDAIAAPLRWQPELATERVASVVARILAAVER